MSEYGLYELSGSVNSLPKCGPHPDYEIDHLIPLGIGGADDDANLWPQPRRSFLRGSFVISDYKAQSACLRARTYASSRCVQLREADEPMWSAERKDELEWRLRDLVCAGQ